MHSVVPITVSRKPGATSPVSKVESSSYTCPMHPEIVSDRPGSCPICGMALEPLTISVGDSEVDHELLDMSRRFWISLVLTTPLVLLSMAEMIRGVGSSGILSGPALVWIRFC